MKKNYKEMLMVAVFTALIGQVHFYPFGTDFRITVGVIIFTYLLLYFHTLPVVATSILTGLSVLLIRMGLDIFTHAVPLDTAFYRHIPALLYYAAYGTLIDKASFRKLFHKPIYFIIILTMADIVSNFFELLIRNQFSIRLFETIFSTIILAAVLRSCIVLILFWIVKYYSQFITNEEHQKRYKELLLLTAKLKSEIFFLKKSMQDIENAMAKSYEIYNTIKDNRPMKQEELDGIMSDSLSLSIDIHEIKKDYNRIVISMEKLMPASEVYKTMKISEVFETIADIFNRYLEVINKDIRLTFHLKKDYRTDEYFVIMSILNNMIQNSIEAYCRKNTFIKIECDDEGEQLVFYIEDNGRGIPEKERELVFEPGFTTKFNFETGQVSTGLGLTHIRMLTAHLGGKITLLDTQKGTTIFKLEFPMERIICEVEADE